MIAWSFPLLLLASGCAQPKEETVSPDLLEQREGEIAQLRRENANLRTEVQSLEERLRLVEGGGGGSGGSSGSGGYAAAAGSSTSLGSVGYDSYGVEAGPEYYAEVDGAPRQLPVVRITPNERSVGSRPASSPPPSAGSRRNGNSISLTPPSDPSPSYADPQYVDARGDYDDYQDQAAYEPPPHEDGNGVVETASYRLVGSRLVQATKSRPSTPTKKASKSTDSRVLKDYKAAMAVYEDGRFAEAEQAFASIVSAHPNHDYADNALYWQGEAAYDQAHYADALAAFTRVVERYGGGNKAPDALLKIGLCYARLGDQANARDVLTQLVAAYPRADASKIAKRKLAELGG